MHKMTHPMQGTTALAMLTLLAVACGPKVEGPFEGEGAYEGPGTQEGQYAENRSPEGWRKDRGAQQARAEEQQRQEEQRQEQARTQPPAPSGQEPADMTRRREPEVAQGQAPPEGRGTNGEEPPAAPEGTQTPTAEAPTAQTEAVAATQEEVRQLRTDAEAIRGSTDLSHNDVIVALRALAATLGGMPSGAEVRDNVDQILAVADQLAASDPYSDQHEEMVHTALRQGMDALTTLAAVSGRQDALEPQIRQLREQVGRLQDQEPLLQQTDVVADSLLGMADAITAFGERPQPPAGTQ
jgi:hypothetical protein